MGMTVTTGCVAMCSFGLAPSTLVASPATLVLAGGRPVLTITDITPMNVPPFGMCSSLANPTVAAATAAALGVLVPMPCTPLLPAPWVPGSPTVMASGKPVVTNMSKCICAFGGVIQVLVPGDPMTLVP